MGSGQEGKTIGVNTKRQLQHIERDLNGIVASIAQVSRNRARRTRRVVEIAAGKVVGVATVGGMLMFISAFGSASTGTAIGVLTGAAATSAQMYWIGSLFGLGAVAGAIILPAIGAVLGLVAAFFLSKAVFGRPRKPAKMEEFEVRALFASMRLASPIPSYFGDTAEPAPSKGELRVYAHEGLLPLCTLIGECLTAPKNPSKTDNECGSFEKTLALLPRWKLRRHHRRLLRRASALACPQIGNGIRGLLRLSSQSRSNA